jgi:hypothetical protein
MPILVLITDGVGLQEGSACPKCQPGESLVDPGCGMQSANAELWQEGRKKDCSCVSSSGLCGESPDHCDGQPQAVQGVGQASTHGLTLRSVQDAG